MSYMLLQPTRIATHLVVKPISIVPHGCCCSVRLRLQGARDCWGESVHQFVATSATKHLKTYSNNEIVLCITENRSIH